MFKAPRERTDRRGITEGAAVARVGVTRPRHLIARWYSQQRAKHRLKSLGRESPPALTSIMRAARPVLRMLGRFRPGLQMHTPEESGQALAQLTLATATPPPGHVYASLVRGQLTYPTPSELAQNDEARDKRVSSNSRWRRKTQE
jgi:hypothetical protein